MRMKRTTVLACLLASAFTAAPVTGAAADVSGPPVMNAPVFNDPTADSGVAGSPSAAQSAVMDQLIRLIKAVPAGGEIRFAMHEFAPGDRSSEVAASLIAAHERGAGVQVIMDSQDDGGNDAVFGQLSAALGTTETAASWAVRCEYPSQDLDRGCIARNYLHDKFATFSRVIAGGATYDKVVFQSSSNLSNWYLYNSYNDGFTLSDATVYDGYVRYFKDLRAGRLKPVNPDYFWTTPTGSTYKGHFFPRLSSAGDPIVNVLKLVKCGYKDAEGVQRQTDVRLALTAWNAARKEIADELIRLRGENCWIDIVYYDDPAKRNVTDHIRGLLARKASNGKYLQVRPCRFTVGNRSVVPHTKLMMIDGAYDGGITPRVYTGSANFTTLENADDSLLRISGRDVHSQYLSWFYQIRSACRGG
ncbi:phospholipase D-like domain-containing protein [Nonomuraea fuscirosea]|uniref:phospholipase D-like domain-containing protein n=1 Tax=Nonomuraea fuscirosea TaxID=1291556 RepID=UPI002DD7C76C|nr:phospholipase D-like domain-containing protein [Nonomuraea fuscirosea]WSA53959.1 phospholipase D-like domain-containing protein [Nonomuraea fuscirosea]